MADANKKAGADVVSRYTPWLARGFLKYLGFYFRRNFHAVRVSPTTPALVPADKKLIVYSNHPSWWDPILFFAVAANLYPDRKPYGPMDADALEKYAFMKKIGIFGVERDSRKGAAGFLREADRIMESGDGLLWLTAQGHFSDVRDRPLGLQPGLAHLMKRHPDAAVVPVAVEYSFWEERTAEALLRIGTPVTAPDAGWDEMEADDATLLLERALEAEMDALAADVKARNPEKFRTVIGGAAGVGFAYDLWRRIKALATGRRFNAAHGSE